MTPLRKLAMKISNQVVCLASPEAKQWARATAREIEFIQSDWTALRWSLGSISILFTPQEAHLTDLAGVPAAAKKLSKRMVLRTWFVCITAVVESLAFARSLHSIHAPATRPGYYLFVASLAYMAVQVLVRRTRRIPSETVPTRQAALYRLDLQGERNYHRGIWFWSRFVPFAFALALFFGGIAFAHPARPRAAFVMLASMSALLVAAIPLNRKQAETYDRQIGELDTILGNQS
jgi:hypothetical protein